MAVQAAHSRWETPVLSRGAHFPGELDQLELVGAQDAFGRGRRSTGAGNGMTRHGRLCSRRYSVWMVIAATMQRSAEIAGRDNRINRPIVRPISLTQVHTHAGR